MSNSARASICSECGMRPGAAYRQRACCEGTTELGDGLEHLAQHRARPVTIDTTNAKLRQEQDFGNGVRALASGFMASVLNKV
jgi:hypothetical protein